VIVPSESTACLTTGFQLLSSLFDSNLAFYGRGKNGPTCFTTDDAEAEIQALKSVWPRYRFTSILLHSMILNQYFFIGSSVMFQLLQQRYIFKLDMGHCIVIRWSDR